MVGLRMAVNPFFLLVIAILAEVANAGPPQKIVGGQSAVAGEFPYQVSLRIHGDHHCGGVIISDKYILTAAHCVMDIVHSYSKMTVVTGTTFLSKGGQVHKISSILIHEEFDTSIPLSSNDIALIKLKSKMRFNKNTSAINLPTSPTDSGTKAIISGWGYIGVNEMDLPETLQKATMTMIDHKECKKRDEDGEFFKEQICAVNVVGIGICQGDSGGPAVVGKELVGIASHNFPCAMGYPDVFTAVYSYVDWIKKNMK